MGTHKTTLLKTTHLATTIAVRVLIMSAVHKPCTVCSCGALNMQDQKMQELKTGDRTPKNAANLFQLADTKGVYCCPCNTSE